MDTLEIIKGKHKCRICGKLINFDNKYKDKSMSFKNHLKQKHNIDIVKYLNYNKTGIKCKWCKTNNVKINFTVGNDFLIIISNDTLCSDLKCIADRKQYNNNSTYYVSKTEECSEQESLLIIKKKNGSPFYKENFKNNENYLKSQKTFSKRCVESYEARGFTKEESKYMVGNYQSILGLKNKAIKLNNKRDKFGRFSNGVFLLKPPIFKIAPLKIDFLPRGPGKFIYNYGSVIGNNYYKEMKLYKDWINTENYFIFLYHNNIINEQKINTYLNVPISIYNKKTVSVASYKFNTELIKLLKIEGFLIKNITYGDCEFSLRTNSNNIRFYDLYFEYENKKIVVEFNGTYWHKNKEERDNEKMNLLKQNNINGFVILEEDYNKTGTIPIFNKIKDLLNENKKN